MNPKDGIELFCRFRDGTVLYWNGNGARKDMGSEESAEMAEEYGHPGGCEGDGTIVQVNITEIWDKISPYLES